MNKKNISLYLCFGVFSLFSLFFFSTFCFFAILTKENFYIENIKNRELHLLKEQKQNDVGIKKIIAQTKKYNKYKPKLKEQKIIYNNNTIKCGKKEKNKIK